MTDAQKALTAVEAAQELRQIQYMIEALPASPRQTELSQRTHALLEGLRDTAFEAPRIMNVVSLPPLSEWHRAPDRLPASDDSVFGLCELPGGHVHVAQVTFYGNEFHHEFRLGDTAVRVTHWLPSGVSAPVAPLTPSKPMCDMTEPELGAHMSRQLAFIRASQSSDTIGTMLVIFQQDGITQYGATIDPETSPPALRELADRIEHNQTVKRETGGG